LFCFLKNNAKGEKKKKAKNNKKKRKNMNTRQKEKRKRKKIIEWGMCDSQAFSYRRGGKKPEGYSCFE
jgi:hypothetical protein